MRRLRSTSNAHGDDIEKEGLVLASLRGSIRRPALPVAIALIAALGATAVLGATPAAVPSDNAATRPGLTVAIPSGLLYLSNTAEGSFVNRFIYNALYRLDDHLEPIPDLASGLCDVAADLLTITCQLREARFHDGSALTADDVVYTY